MYLVMYASKIGFQIAAERTAIFTFTSFSISTEYSLHLTELYSNHCCIILEVHQWTLYIPCCTLVVHLCTLYIPCCTAAAPICTLYVLYESELIQNVTMQKCTIHYVSDPHICTYIYLIVLLKYFYILRVR